MDNTKLIIYGVGPFAEYASYVFEKDSQYTVEGFCMESSYLEQKPEIQKDEIHSFDKLEEKFPTQEYSLFIAVGNNIIRERIFKVAKEKGYNLATYVSSKTFLWENIKLGVNCFIGEGSVLQPFISIKDNTIIFCARIGHHCKIGNHSLLSSCTLGGNVNVGDFSFLGLNSIIQEKVVIGSKNMIGMGVIITKNTEPNSIYSAPSSKKRNVSFDDFYRNY